MSKKTDKNQVANALKDPISIHGGPMTSTRIKKIK